MSTTHLSLYRLNPATSLFSLNQGLKITKNNFLYQNLIGKKLRCQNCIIYIIFKVRGSECNFPETFNMPPMFGALFIGMHLTLIGWLGRKWSVPVLVGLQAWDADTWRLGCPACELGQPRAHTWCWLALGAEPHPRATWGH